MINKKIKKENGFAGSDALIAVLIIVLFTGIIATIIYNIYLSNASIKRMGTATKYITNIFENMDKAYYDDVTLIGLKDYINANSELFSTSENQINISSNNTSESGESIGITDNPRYTINVDIEYYNKTQGNEDKLDLVKQITVTVIYKLGNKNQEITMTRVKSRERLLTPNIPDISLLEIEETKVYPVKKVNNKWKVCDSRDSGWYNYESGYWATIIISNQELKIDDEVNIDDYILEGNMYVWIPRFAYDLSNNSILFLYSNTNNYVNNNGEYNSLLDLENTFGVLQDFKTGDQENTGIWINNTLGDAYTKLNSIYERKV